MRLVNFLLPLVVIVHISALQLAPDQRHQMVEGGAFAAPHPHALEERIDIRTAEQPRSLMEKASILDSLITLVTDLIPGLLSIFTQEERECEFVGQVNASILLAHRDLNVIIFTTQVATTRACTTPSASTKISPCR